MRVYAQVQVCLYLCREEIAASPAVCSNVRLTQIPYVRAADETCRYLALFSNINDLI